MNDIFSAVLKTALGVGVAAPSIVSKAPPHLTAIPEPYLVALCLFVSCVGGAYASFSWGDPVEPRKKMMNLFISCVIMGLAFTALVNFAVEFWLKAELTLGVRAGMGAVVSCLTRFIMPKVIEGIKDGTWRSFIPFLKKDKA